MTINTTGVVLCANADWSKVVPEDSSDAAFLLAGIGCQVAPEHVDLYLAHVGGDETAADEPEPEKVVRFGGEAPANDDDADTPETESDPEPERAETPKPRKRAAKKAAARSDD